MVSSRWDLEMATKLTPKTRVKCWLPGPGVGAWERRWSRAHTSNWKINESRSWKTWCRDYRQPNRMINSKSG